MRHGSGSILLTAAFQFSFGAGTVLSSPDCRHNGSWGGESLGRAELRQRAPTSTWTSFVTITVTTILGVDPTTPLQTLTTSHTPLIVTVPGPATTTSIKQSSATLIISSGISTSAISSVATSENPPTSTSDQRISTPTSLFTALTPTSTATSTSSSPTSTIIPTISAMSLPASGANISFTSSLKSLTYSSVVTSETLTTSVAPAEPTSPAVEAPGPVGDSLLLESGQIAAIIAGLIAFGVFILVVIYIIRAYVIHQRQNLAQKRQELDEATVVSQPIQSGAAGSGVGTSYSHGAGSRSGFGASGDLHDSEIRIVIQPTPPTTHLNRGLWPNPPGYTERHTYFSGRSTTTTEGENSTDRGQWSRGTEHGSSGLSRVTPR